MPHFAAASRLPFTTLKNEPWVYTNMRMQKWSVRQLQRQVVSPLYARLALSRNKDDILKLANEGQSIENQRDVFKTPTYSCFPA